MTERTHIHSDRPGRHVSAPRPPERSEMNYRHGRPDLELYDLLEALHEGADDPGDMPGHMSLQPPPGHADAGRRGWRR